MGWGPAPENYACGLLPGGSRRASPDCRRCPHYLKSVFRVHFLGLVVKFMHTIVFFYLFIFSCKTTLPLRRGGKKAAAAALAVPRTFSLQPDGQPLTLGEEVEEYLCLPVSGDRAPSGYE